MDNKEDIVPKEGSWHIMATKTELDLEKSLSSLQEVKEECTDDDYTWGNFLYEPEASEAIEFKPNHSSGYDLVPHLKNELCEEEDVELTCHSGNRIAFEDDGMLKFIEDKQEHNNNNNEKQRFFLNTKNENKEYQVTIKTERLEDSDVLNEDEKTSVHYDILVTPKLVQCKWCDRIFKNRFHLLKHNTVHMKLNINITSLIINNSNDKIVSINERKSKRIHSKLYHCKKCNSRMQYCNKQRHIETVHSSTEAFCCDLCDKEFRCIKYLQKHMTIHKSKKSNSVKCQHCDKSFKHKYNLTCHVTNCHSNEVLQCNSCGKVFKSRPYLLTHIKRIHQDYGKVFECWCGKEFLTPRRLAYHKRARHG